MSANFRTVISLKLFGPSWLRREVFKTSELYFAISDKVDQFEGLFWRVIFPF